MRFAPIGTASGRGEIARRTFRLSAATAAASAAAIRRADLAHVRAPKPGDGATSSPYELRYRRTPCHLGRQHGADPPRRVQRHAVLLGELYERYAPSR